MATKKKPIKKKPVTQKTKKPAENIVIPANIGNISVCCDKHSSGYAIEGFRLQVKEDGSYEAAATDSLCMAIVRGKRVEAPLAGKTTTHRSGINTSKPFDAIVSPKDWRSAVAASSDIEKMIGVAQQGKSITLVCDDKRSIATQRLEGRFPSCESLVPIDTPKQTIEVDCKLLAKIAACASNFSDDITIEFRAEDQALVFRGTNDVTGQEFIGLLMPLANES